MKTSFRAACRRILPPSVLRARRVLIHLPRVIARKAVQDRRHYVRRASALPSTILTYPFRPNIEDDYSIVLIACRLGLKLTTDPRSRFAAALHWHDTTRRSLNPVLEQLAASMPVINLRGNDISKTRVDAAMQEVFGYSLAVDPLATHGPLVDKSDSNALHDGRIVTGPLQARAAGRVYQRYIQGRRVGTFVEELRVPVVGPSIPFVQVKYKDADRPLALSVRGTAAEASTVFSHTEIAWLIRYAQALGLDFCEIDVMRDHRDDRLYVFDANNTPCVRFVGVTASDRRIIVDRLATAFETNLLAVQCDC